MEQQSIQPSNVNRLTLMNKDLIIKEFVESQLSPEDLGRKWGCHPDTIRTWVSKAQKEIPEASKKKENTILKTSQDIKYDLQMFEIENLIEKQIQENIHVGPPLTTLEISKPQQICPSEKKNSSESKCPICKQCVSGRMNLHIEYDHHRNKKKFDYLPHFTCETCGSKFLREGEFDKHKEKIVINSRIMYGKNGVKIREEGPYITSVCFLGVGKHVITGERKKKKKRNRKRKKKQDNDLKGCSLYYGGMNVSSFDENVKVKVEQLEYMEHDFKEVDLMTSWKENDETIKASCELIKDEEIKKEVKCEFFIS